MNILCVSEENYRSAWLSENDHYKRICDLLPDKITLVKYTGTVPADSTVETPDNSEDSGTSEGDGGGSLI